MAVNAGASYSLARGKAAAVTREGVERQGRAALSDARGKVTAVTRAGRERENLKTVAKQKQLPSSAATYAY